MENAHIFAQGEMDERRFNLHLDFPEEPIQGNGAIRDFHVQEELLSCLLLSEEPVLLRDFLRDWNLKRKSQVKKTESNFISSSSTPPHGSDLAREGDSRLLPHARTVGFPFFQSVQRSHFQCEFLGNWSVSRGKPIMLSLSSLPI